MSEDDNDPTNTFKLSHVADIFAQEWNEGESHEEIESKSIFIGLPQPLYTTSPKPLHGDPYVVLLSEKQRYINNIKKCVKYAKKSRINISDINIHTAKYVVLPKNVWRLACNIKDPDPFFNGDYNWYYTNGVLDSFQMGSSTKNYLIRPDESNGIIITNPHDITESYSIQNQGDIICGLKSNIINHECFVTARRKFSIELHHFNDVEEIMPKPTWSLTSINVPFVDAKIDPNKSHDINVLKADQTLRVYDVEANHEKLTQNFSNSSQDNFAQIDYYENNNIIFMDRKNVKIFDERSSIATHKINLGECDYLSAFTVFDGNVYVATKNQILQLDKHNFGVLNKTFHLMNGCPFIIKPIENKMGAFMALANDKHRVIVDLNDGLPREIPSLIDTFSETQLKGNIYLNKNIEAIVACSTIGMCCDDSVIYTCNSCGDLFEQNYSFEKPLLNDTEKFDLWIKNIPDCDTKKLYHTGFVDMSRAKFTLYSPYDESIINKMEKRCEFEPEVVTYDEGTYARDMEVIWLDQDESEDLVAPVPEVTSVKKVSEWLTSFTDYAS